MLENQISIIIIIIVIIIIIIIIINEVISPPPVAGVAAAPPQTSPPAGPFSGRPGAERHYQPGDSAGPEGLDLVLRQRPVPCRLLQQEQQLHGAAVQADRR